MDLTPEKLYSAACVAALQDGKLQPQESALLGTLRDYLKLPDEVVRRLDDEARKKGAPTGYEPLEPEKLYEQACRIALEDGVVDYEEAHHLGSLADALELSTERATEILENLDVAVEELEIRIGAPLEDFEGEDLEF